MKTILILRSTFHPGGTENLLARLFNHPSPSFRVVLVLLKAGELMNDLKESQNKVVHLYRKSKWDIAFIVKLVSLIRREKPFAIHSHQLIELLYASLVKTIIPSIKLFHHVHLHNKPGSVLLFIEKVLCNLFVRKTIAVSQTLSEFLINNGFSQRKILVLHNIISITDKMRANEEAEFKMKINYSKSDYLIGMIGNFVYEKDQPTLAKAFKSISSGRKDLKLVFIGKITEFTNLTRAMFTDSELGDSVFFVGQIPNASELIKYFKIMVFSSKIETFGMAALEALLYKVPVIASDIPVMKELSHQGKYFTLFPGGDADTLARILKSIIACANPPYNLQDSRDYVLREFSAEEYNINLNAIYES